LGAFLFKGLTQRVQRILSVDAQEQVRRFNSEQLLPEHIMIAILKDGAGIASKSLMFLRIDLAEFRHIIEGSIPRVSSVLIHGDALPSKRTKTLLDLAAAEARAMGSDYLGTEHLLFAAMREQNSTEQTYLSARAVDLDMLRVVVQTTFNKHTTQKKSAEIKLLISRYFKCHDNKINFLQKIKFSLPNSNPADLTCGFFSAFGLVHIMTTKNSITW
jgi:ATP-dependent Clp protease ATP-binding subunit ClpC